MKLDALDHPKTLDLAARLNVELPTAIGHLELLWAFTSKKAPQGNIGKWPDGAISRACYWMGRPEVFLQALHDSGFLDADDVHRFTIHDWHEHAPRWVRAKLAKADESFVNTRTTDPSEGSSTDPTVVDTTGPTTKRREEKRREEQGKGRDKRTRARAAPTPSVPAEGLHPQAWDRFFQYRIDIRKPLKPASIPAAQQALAAFGSDQEAVVQQSIANGWQGLFPLKSKTNGSGDRPELPVRKTRFEQMQEALKNA